MKTISITDSNGNLNRTIEEVNEFILIVDTVDRTVVAGNASPEFAAFAAVTALRVAEKCCDTAQEEKCASS